MGFAPDDIGEDKFSSIVSSGTTIDSPRFAEQLKEFIARCSYVSGKDGGDSSFQALSHRLHELGQDKKEQHRLFYMALPPSAFELVSAGLKKFCYSVRGSNRIIVGHSCFPSILSSLLLQSEHNAVD